jgi:hypothetical protein
MAGDDTGAVGKGEDATGGIEFMGKSDINAAAEVIESLEVGLADAPEEEAFEAGDTLAIVGTQLGEEPMGFAAPAGTAVADGGGAIRVVAKAGGGAGGELARLEDSAGADEIFHLVAGATGVATSGGILKGIELFTHRYFF